MVYFALLLAFVSGACAVTTYLSSQISSLRWNAWEGVFWTSSCAVLAILTTLVLS